MFLFVFSITVLIAGNLNAQTSKEKTLTTTSDKKSEAASEETVYQDNEVKVTVKTDAKQNKQYFAVNQFGDIVNLIFDDNSDTNTTITNGKKGGSIQNNTVIKMPPIKFECPCVERNPEGVCIKVKCHQVPVKQ